MQDALDERKKLDEQFETTGRSPQGILIERPSTSPDTHPVNGNYSLPDEDEDETEDDLILGDEDELSGDEEEYEIEVDELDEEDIDEDDLVIEADEDDLDEDDDH
jgi:hypothetical protein